MSAYTDAQAQNDISRNVRKYRDIDLLFGRKPVSKDVNIITDIANIKSAAIGDAISSSPNNALVFKGGIDAVSVYNKTLTQAEVTALYNSGVPTTCSDASVTSNLMAEYRLENNTTNTSGTFPSLTNTGGTFTTY
jgi:hypothetical protein